MMKDEGVIKFNCRWTATPLPADISCGELLTTRNKLFRLGGIGYDAAEQVGYGNISIRTNADHAFVISGTQTGHIPVLTEAGLSCVQQADIATNTVDCTGPAKASSESMTHAAIYQLFPQVTAVIHIHHKALWLSLMHRLPTTKASIGYGTTAMANEITRLVTEENLAVKKILVMAGHDDGIICFGDTMAEAEKVLMQYWAEMLPHPINALP